MNNKNNKNSEDVLFCMVMMEYLNKKIPKKKYSFIEMSVNGILSEFPESYHELVERAVKASSVPGYTIKLIDASKQLYQITRAW